MDLALEILPQVLVDGLVLGFMYALIALGYTMVYGVLEFINFAHSEIFVLGAFVGVEILLIADSLPWRWSESLTGRSKGAPGWSR
ncbi:MAG: branched-chain amino acid ABC transporter permease [Deltaproteobacteria bacterium]|nr:branched-chain amino acid ABC transporter permease [Deltaproteobacteria bacterium]